MAQLIEHFSFNQMHIQGPIVDLKKLDWINGQWIRRLSDDELAERLMPFLSKDLGKPLLKSILPLIKDRLITLSDIQELTEYFFTDPQIEKDQLLKQSKRDSDDIKMYIESANSVITNTQPFDSKHLETSLREHQESSELNPRQAFMTLRYALTGKTATPPLFEIMEVLGKQTCSTRLSNAIALLQS